MTLRPLTWCAILAAAAIAAAPVLAAPALTAPALTAQPAATATLRLAQWHGGPPPGHAGPMPGRPAPGRPPIVVDGSWRLVAVDREVAPAAVRDRVRIDFAPDGQIVGQGVCNSFNGRYAKRGDDIIIERIVSTRMFCGHDQAWEDALMRALSEVDQVQTGENQALVLSSRGRARIRLRRF